MFQYYGHRHVYSPGADIDNPLGPKCFLKHKSSVHLLISSKISAIKLHFPICFPFQCMGELSRPCRKLGQGQPRVMIYINFVELNFQILHTKFQNHRPSGSEEEDLTFLLFTAMAAILVM